MLMWETWTWYSESVQLEINEKLQRKQTLQFTHTFPEISVYNDSFWEKSHYPEHAAAQTHTPLQFRISFCFISLLQILNKWINNNINDEHAHFHNVHNVKLICKCLLAASLALITDRPQVTALTAGQTGQMCHTGWVGDLGNLIPLF